MRPGRGGDRSRGQVIAASGVTADSFAHLLVAAGYNGEIDHEELWRTGEQMLPIIGPVPGVVGAYVAVMHSAVTLAATVGRVVASEIVDGVDAASLAGLRPARFRSIREL